MALNQNTGFKRATTATVTNFESGSILLAGESIASSSTVGGILVLEDFDYTIPNGATIEGIQVQSKVLNEGSGSVPEYGDLTVRAQVGYSDGYGTNNDVTLSDNTLTNLDFGGSTSLQGKTWNSTQANNLQLKFTYQEDDSGFSDTQLLAISGSSTNLLPAVNVYYSFTPDVSYDRQELKQGVTSSQIFDSDDIVQFTLENNRNATTYFTIEGGRYLNDNGILIYKDIFNLSSAYNLNNCTVVSSSVHAVFIIKPNATATFNFNPLHDIQKNEIKFKAANVESTNLLGTTFYGVNLAITSV